MLKTDMIERTNKSIPITNAKVEDIRQLVKYIYAAKVSPEPRVHQVPGALRPRGQVQRPVAGRLLYHQAGGQPHRGECPRYGHLCPDLQL